MVYVNDKKFACESCIKGHRSSSCQHADRPLFEIKKKGRPVSQCERCRELRKTKRMHSKCTCGNIPSTSEAGPSPQTSTAMAGADEGAAPKPRGVSLRLCRPVVLVSSQAARRFKPIAPALPNGIKDILPPATIPTGSTSLNLCRCGGKDASICTCGHERARTASLPGPSGLAALAQAAMFCCGNDRTSAIVPPPAPLMVVAALEQSSTSVPQADDSRKHPRGCCSSQSSSRPPSPKPKRCKRVSNTHTHESSSTSGTVTLPPLFYGSAASSASAVPPTFPPIPSFSAATSYEAPECCCGTDCACPGCLKHRGAAHASRDFEDCTEGSCGICVDHEGGVALHEDAFAASHGGFASTSSVGGNGGFTPTSAPFSLTRADSEAYAAPVTAPSQKSPATSSASTSFIDAFFARAAALPPPPARHSRGGTQRPGALDPTDVRVYPRDLFAGGAEERKAAFGLVAVPKLECHCPGGCGCPEGRCACGDSCTGCGSDGGENDEVRVQEEPEDGLRSRREPAAVGGCCC
ncbi:hypothetical protein BC628DRAFT_1374965 [Trametes gibbosa]|nr:hypothetical protein BC628DRAFT_1374965 [Trametes gibbosa]QPL20071.1 metal-binding regulatory protein Cuf1 [Trametes gibbosa]